MMFIYSREYCIQKKMTTFSILYLSLVFHSQNNPLLSNLTMCNCIVNWKKAIETGDMFLHFFYISHGKSEEVKICSWYVSILLEIRLKFVTWKVRNEVEQLEKYLFSFEFHFEVRNKFQFLNALLNKIQIKETRERFYSWNWAIFFRRI